jgi:hypothetical protein
MCVCVCSKKELISVSFFMTLEEFISAYYAYNAGKWMWFSFCDFYNQNKSIMSIGRKYVMRFTSGSCCRADILHLFMIYNIRDRSVYNGDRNRLIASLLDYFISFLWCFYFRANEVNKEIRIEERTTTLEQTSFSYNSILSKNERRNCLYSLTMSIFSEVPSVSSFFSFWWF